MAWRIFSELFLTTAGAGTVSAIARDRFRRALDADASPLKRGPSFISHFLLVTNLHQRHKPEFAGKWVPISQAFDLQMGKTPSRDVPEYWNNGDHDWVSIKDLGSYEKYVGRTSETISERGRAESGIKPVPANTLLMSFKLSLGKAAITTRETYTNEAIMAFLDKGTYDVDIDYMWHQFRSKDWSAGTNTAVMGKTLNKKTLGSTLIRVPPMAEQREVAKRLDFVERVLSLLRRERTALDDLVKSQFVEMFGDPIANSNALPTKKLIDVVTMQRGYDWPVTQRVGDGGVPVYGSNGIVGFHDVSRRTEPCVVTGRSGTIGDVRFVQRPCWPLNTTLFSSDTHGNNVIYLAYLLKFFKLERFTAGSGVPTLNRNLFHKELIIDAPLALQQQFADFVAEVDKLRFDSHSNNKISD